MTKMQIISDLHIHSRFSRGCSKDLGIDSLEKYSEIKGLDLLGTGDFTHPEWIKELKKKLTEDNNGILKTKNGFPFVLQTEISLIYSQGGKGRRIHNVVLAPSFDVVEQITEYLLKKGRVDYDGRPIFKIPCDEFVYELRKISDKVEVIPAHIWTPWFSLFGSNSGFDSVQECFGDQTKNIHAMETGLSSDPEMNWRLSQLDPFVMVSFSDTHSYWPWRIGREATIFELKELTYDNIIKAIRTRQGLKETIEVDPAYGKYHEDGHRNCNVCMSPKDAIKNSNICPVCKRPLTIGVHHRIEELADRPEGFKPKNAIPFKTLIPLSEILSSLLGKGVATNTVWKEFYKLLKLGKSEMDILLNVPEEKLKQAADEKIAEAIIKNREGKIDIKPGYDGQYGKAIIGETVEEPEPNIKPNQSSIKDFC
jgi:uncharacterized protein (TIGR00375 family)